MNLSIHDFSIRLAHSQILEYVLALGGIQCSPHTLLIDLPRDIEECRRACACPRQESKDESPTVMLGVPHKLVLVEVRLEHRDLQCAINEMHESHARSVSIQDLLLRLE